MGIKDKFAEQFARQKTMSGPEKKANDLIGKLLLKKAILPIVIAIVAIIVGSVAKIPWWGILIIEALIAVATYFYLKKAGDKFNNFVPYVGNLITLEKKGKNEYTALLKQGKKPVKLDIKYGGEDLERVKKNALIQVTYNPDAKIAILVTRKDAKR
ncbi:hypothetical protein HLB30_02105 [Peptostreptococcus russellii]|uniref:Uncharacterized protein n=2 Tax=Peptostreptococcus russellii TaxID=215200 RepID=A0A1H8F6W4_9FIRM|nr:hypothetical protein [Peptostreptococcus russellii]MBC2577307.1 hypothetical protein [Peptostreptococcus russellii]SEN27603.1 hypothetical protein SAMN05216454_10220 [Peptostreptococcus russellii]